MRQQKTALEAARLDQLLSCCWHVLLKSEPSDSRTHRRHLPPLDLGRQVTVISHGVTVVKMGTGEPLGLRKRGPWPGPGELSHILGRAAEIQGGRLAVSDGKCRRRSPVSPASPARLEHTGRSPSRCPGSSGQGSVQPGAGPIVSN